MLVVVDTPTKASKTTMRILLPPTMRARLTLHQLHHELLEVENR